MKGKQLVILLVLAALGGGVWYVLTERTRASWSESAGGGARVLDFPINDVAHLKIKSSEGEVNLVKKGGGWVVQERADYPASFDQVGAFLRRLWELRTGQEVKVGPSQIGRLELVAPGHGDKAGTLVELGGVDGKTLAALLIGKKYGSKPGGQGPLDVPRGRYVKALNGAKVSLVSDSLDDAQPKPGLWLLKDFVHVTAPKSITALGPVTGETWSVSREEQGAEWQLADANPGEQADHFKTFRFSWVFEAPTYFDVLAPESDPAVTGLDHPRVVKIDTFEGFHYELQIGRADGETFPVHVSVTADLPKKRTPAKDEKPEDRSKLDDEFQARQKQLAQKLEREQKFASRVFLVPKVNVGELLNDRAALLVDKRSEPARDSR